MGLKEYRKKRNFSKTREPSGKKISRRSKLYFVIQKHAARRLHYDFRLELNGVLLSWAVPKGPSLDPQVKRLAIHVEDHPIEYGKFEGTIPEGEYGGGSVLLWDRGYWIPDNDPVKSYKEGRLKFKLNGKKLRGGWSLIKLKSRSFKGDNSWLLIKEKDKEAKSEGKGSITEKKTLSVLSQKDISEISDKNRAQWSSKKLKDKKMKRESVSDMSGAIKSQFPKIIWPQLARLVDETPKGSEWLHEVKFDGYRLLTRWDHGKIKFFTRNGNDWTHRFPNLKEELKPLRVKEAWLDGEAVAFNSQKKTSFQELQRAFETEKETKIHYFVFDMIYLDGFDLSQVELIKRKQLLRELIDTLDSSRVHFSDHLLGRGDEVQKNACKHRLEGVVSKKINSFYVPGRASSWLKSKCIQEEEFIIGGFTDPKRSRSGFGALLLGVYDQDDLIYAGKVGTGFNQTELANLRKRLDLLTVSKSPFKNPPSEKTAHWVKPKLVAQIYFTEKTNEGLLRHPSFLGLREDKTPEDVRSETSHSYGVKRRANEGK
ncbi:MAG: ligD [Bacteriovoracaceae bacterium]|nr:ligD [Bacteriovoracaceae bacterium]